MATGVTEIQEVRVREPVVAVQSRVSWGALLAGATVAVAIYSLLTMLGIAIGFTVFDRVNADQLGTGAAIWAFAILLISLFFGGWVSTQCTVGENRTEAILYGIIVWGITSSLLIPLTAAGVGMGFGTVLAERGIAAMNNAALPPAINPQRIGREASEALRDRRSDSRDSDRSQTDEASNTEDRNRNDDRTQRSDGSSDRTNRTSTESSNDSADTDASRNASRTDGSDRSGTDRDNTTKNRERTSRDDRTLQRDPKAQDHLKSASWWAFGGTLVSLLAAVSGALLGPYNIVVRREIRARPTAVVATRTQTPLG